MRPGSEHTRWRVGAAAVRRRCGGAEDARAARSRAFGATRSAPMPAHQSDNAVAPSIAGSRCLRRGESHVSGDANGRVVQITRGLRVWPRAVSLATLRASVERVQMQSVASRCVHGALGPGAHLLRPQLRQFVGVD